MKLFKKNKSISSDKIQKDLNRLGLEEFPSIDEKTIEELENLLEEKRKELENKTGC